jgi:RecA/RadA recombinase
MPVLDGLPDGGPEGLEVRGELGHSGHSVVYRVRRGHDEYALKVLPPAATCTADALAAVRREAALLAGVEHPDLARIHDVGKLGDRPYVVMDLVDGRSLAHVLAEGLLGEDRTVALAVDIAGVLSAVHAVGLVHRDVKPQNIIVTSGGKARLIDFGLSARGAGDVGEVAGTLAYAPPEQSGMVKRPTDGRSDLYSLGVVLFQCVTARLPFPASDVGELLRMHATMPAPDPRELVPGLSQGFAAVVLALLEKDLDDRYQDAQALLADLGRLGAGGPRSGFVPCCRGDHRAPPRRLGGRWDEISRLRQRWSRAVAGQGRACLVRGASGTGKTRLATELAMAAQAGGGVVLQGKCTPDDPVPLSVLRSAIEGHVLTTHRLTGPERDAAHARLRAAACAGTGAETKAAVLATVSPALGALLGAGRAPSDLAQDQFTAVVAGFVVELARAAPAGLMVYLDDVQWLDTGTLRVLQHIADEVAGVGLLVLATARDGPLNVKATEAFRTAAGDALDLDIALGPLSSQEMSDVVTAHLPGVDIAPQLAGILTVRADGNPFVALEYLAAIVDAGLLCPVWGHWVLDEAGLDALGLSGQALGLVLARAEGLGPTTRDLLVTAAALGSRFRTDDLATVCQLGAKQVQDALNEAATRRLVQARGPGEYAFLHDRIREALLDNVSATDLAEMHQCIAEALDAVPPGGAPPAEPERVYAVAHRYMRGVPGRAPERVLRACTAAGRLALANHAPTDAVAFLDHAAGLGLPAQAALLHDLGTALAQDDQHPAAIARLDQALGLSTAPLERAAVLAELAEAYRATWQTGAANTAAESGLAELGAPLPHNGVVLALSATMRFAAGVLMRWTRIGYGTARGEDRERCRLIDKLHEVAGYGAMLDARVARLVACGMRSVYWLHRLGPCDQYARGTAGFAWVVSALGLTRTARRIFARAERTAAALGDPRATATVAWYRGASAYMSGCDDGTAWRRALDEYDRWLDFGPWCDGAGSFCSNAAVAGRTQDALTWRARTSRRLRANGVAQTAAATVAYTASFTVYTAALMGRAAEAGTTLDRVKDITRAHGARGFRMRIAMWEIYVLLEQDEIGARTDAAIVEFLGFGVPPALLIRQFRPVLVHIALARLAQARAAGASERAERLAMARTAVRQLRRGAKTPDLRAWLSVARAGLDCLEDRPERALDRLAQVRPQRPDAPMVTYEAARARARALVALGYTAEAQCQAEYAQMLARKHGWPHRARWAAAELGLDDAPADRARSSSAHLTASTSTTMSSGHDIDLQRLRALEQVSLAASRVADPEELARIALDETRRILGAERAVLFLAEGPGAPLVAYLARDATGSDIAELSGYSTSVVETVCSTGQPLVLTGADEGAVSGAESVVLHGLRSVLAAPLHLDDRLLGVVYLDSQVAKGIFTADDVDILTAITTHIATSFETARAAQLQLAARTALQRQQLAEALRDALETMSATLVPQGHQQSHSGVVRSWRGWRQVSH